MHRKQKVKVGLEKQVRTKQAGYKAIVLNSVAANHLGSWAVGRWVAPLGSWIFNFSLILTNVY